MPQETMEEQDVDEQLRTALQEAQLQMWRDLAQKLLAALEQVGELAFRAGADYSDLAVPGPRAFPLGSPEAVQQILTRISSARREAGVLLTLLPPEADLSTRAAQEELLRWVFDAGVVASLLPAP